MGDFWSEENIARRLLCDDRFVPELIESITGVSEDRQGELIMNDTNLSSRISKLTQKAEQEIYDFMFEEDGDVKRVDLNLIFFKLLDFLELNTT